MHHTSSKRTYLATSLAALLGMACGQPASSATPAASDVGSATSDGGGDVGTADAAPGDAMADTHADAKADVAVDVGPCPDHAGAYAVTGTCTGGSSSIPFACYQQKSCDVSWIADYRIWAGTQTGMDYSLSNPSAGDKITGHFDDDTSGNYTYVGTGIECDSTMEKIEPSSATSLCCDPVSQDCGAPTLACVLVSENVNGKAVVTTGCVPLAQTPTAIDASCSPGSAAVCAAGAICSPNLGGKSGDPSTCVKLCAAQGDCPGDQDCVVLADAPRAGACLPRCKVFGDSPAGVACTASQVCSIIVVADSGAERVMSATCLVSAGAKAGAPCNSASSCAAGLGCGDGTCRPLCDSVHPCVAGGTCTKFYFPASKPLDGALGYCK